MAKTVIEVDIREAFAKAFANSGIPVVTERDGSRWVGFEELVEKLKNLPVFSIKSLEGPFEITVGGLPDAA